MFVILIHTYYGFGNNALPEYKSVLLLRKLTTIYLFVGIIVCSLFVGSYYITVQKGSYVKISEYEPTSEFSVLDINYNDHGFINLILSVDRFRYSYNNPCTGLIHGYDINVSIGKLVESTGKIHVYKSKLITEWPIMSAYPNDEVHIETNCVISNPEEKLVLLIKMHDGSKYVQYLDKECLTVSKNRKGAEQIAPEEQKGLQKHRF